MGGFRKILAGLVAATLVVAMTGCAGPAAKSDGDGAASDETYKVGAVLSLTGTYAALGTAEQNAIKLEVERINKAGGINGRQLEVIIEDDATDESKAVGAATKLIDQDGVIAILGASGTGQSMAMRAEVQRAGIPQISMAGGTVITSEFDPLVFQTPWSNKLVVPFVLDALVAQGHTKVALLSDTGGYGKDGHAVIVAEAPAAGIEIVSDQTFNPGDTDMSAQLTKIKGSDAQAILVWNAGKEASIIVKNAQDLGLGLPLFGGSGQARAEFIEGSGDAAEGFVFGTGKSLIPENWEQGSDQYATVSDFASRYRSAYNEDPDIFAGHAFDAVTILADGLKRAGEKADAKSLRDAIEGTSGLPGFGGTFSFSASDHNGLTASDLALYRVDGGKWVVAQ